MLILLPNKGFYFCRKLKNTLGILGKCYINVLMGDLNAEIGSNNIGYEKITEKLGQ